MDFKQRLQKATERGKQTSEQRKTDATAAAMSEEDRRRLHSSFRLPMTEHIEQCLHGLADNFPGFQSETILDTTGWGSAVYRDDVSLNRGKRGNLFSRLQVIVGPYGKYGVLDISAKGTVRNKECFTRSHFQELEEVDPERFRELIELWVLDYAEMYAAS